MANQPLIQGNVALDFLNIPGNLEYHRQCRICLLAVLELPLQPLSRASELWSAASSSSEQIQENPYSRCAVRDSIQQSSDVCSNSNGFMIAAGHSMEGRDHAHSALQLCAGPGQVCLQSDYCEP